MAGVTVESSPEQRVPFMHASVVCGRRYLAVSRAPARSSVSTRRPKLDDSM